MLLKRVLTVAVLLPLFLAALFLLPNPVWGLLLTLVAVVAGYEWGRLAGYSRAGKALFCAVLVACCMAILWWEHGSGAPRAFIHSPAGKLFYCAAVAFWLIVAPAWLAKRWSVRRPIVLGVIGWIVLMPFWHALVALQPTPGRLLLAMGIVWVADTAAYFAGRRFGHRKLAPEISPGKTWEGVWGAAAAVVVYWALASVLLGGRDMHPLSGLVWMLLMLVLSVVGDLFESWMKRVAGVKDSGRILPGHGGLLDRVDGLTATLPLAALYFAYPLAGI
jgi:phosphatidate cytidylyltransferase